MPKPLATAIRMSSQGDAGPAPIVAEWIISGAPQARYRQLVKSGDGTVRFVVWECSAGTFNWHYQEEEAFVIISGSTFLTADDGTETLLGPGDMAYCPSGSSYRWRIPTHVKKIAVLRQPLPAPVGLAFRIWHKLLAMIGSARSPALPPMAAPQGQRSVRVLAL